MPRETAAGTVFCLASPGAAPFSETTTQKRMFRDKGVLLQKSSEMTTWFAKHMSCGSRQSAASPLLKVNKSPPANFSTGTKWVWRPKTGRERVIWNHHQIIPNHKTCRADHPMVRWADKKEFFGQTERLWMRENEKDDYGRHEGRGKDYWLDSGFSEHLYANDFSTPGSGNIWRHLTLRGQPRLFPHLQTQKFHLSWTRPPGCPTRRPVFSRPTSEPHPTPIFSNPSSWLPASQSWGVDTPPTCHTQWQRLIPLCHHLGHLRHGTMPLTHPASLGNKYASPPLPRREGTWGWCEVDVRSMTCSRRGGEGSPQALCPTRLHLPVGPLRRRPPPSSSSFSWLPACSLLDLLPHRCQGSFQIYM